jgi:excisionase family DNA binding protein
MQTISIAEAARRLNRSNHTVKKWISAGLIKAIVFPGGRLYIEVEELERFYKSLRHSVPE